MNVNSGMITVFVVRPSADGKLHEFLQLFRASHTWAGNTWQVVRGKVEKGETFIDGALRELREETQIVPREFYRVGTVETFYTAFNDTIWHSVPFCAIVDHDQPVNLNPEHTDYRWIHRDQMDGHVMWASERQILADLCRDILDKSPAKDHLRIELPTGS